MDLKYLGGGVGWLYRPAENVYTVLPARDLSVADLAALDIPAGLVLREFPDLYAPVIDRKGDQEHTTIPLPELAEAPPDGRSKR